MLTVLPVCDAKQLMQMRANAELEGWIAMEQEHTVEAMNAVSTSSMLQSCIAHRYGHVRMVSRSLWTCF